MGGGGLDSKIQFGHGFKSGQHGVSGHKGQSGKTYVSILGQTRTKQKTHLVSIAMCCASLDVLVSLVVNGA